MPPGRSAYWKASCSSVSVNSIRSLVPLSAIEMPEKGKQSGFGFPYDGLSTLAPRYRALQILWLTYEKGDHARHGLERQQT